VSVSAGGTPSSDEAGSGRWDAYYRTVSGREPRDTLLAALAEAGDVAALRGPDGEPPLAIDLACGDGTDVRALLAAGWRVLAVDSSPDVPAHLTAGLTPELRTRLQVQIADFRTDDLPPCALLHSGFGVFFCPPADFPALWRRIRAALAPGAVLSLHLLGPRDSWHERPGITTHSRAEVEELLAGLRVVGLDEAEEDGWSCDGEKHWHRWHVLARRA